MLVVFYSLLAFTLIAQLSYYILFTTLLSKSKQVKVLPQHNGVSIIICAKNEATNLQQNLAAVLQQQYPLFEVIVVNDQSTDQTQQVLDSFLKQHHHMKVLQTNASDLRGKRNALLTGIKPARFDYVLLTDADCQPLSQHWIRNMLNALQENTEVVLGYSPYKKLKGFVPNWVQWETKLVAMQYGLMTMLGKPYMGVGRNVLVKKALLTDAVFQKSNNSLGGDDDLLLAQIMNNKNTELQLSQDAWCISNPASTWKQLVLQKSRHYNAGFAYSLHNKLKAALYPFLHISFIALLLIGLAICAKGWFLLLIYYIEQIVFILCLNRMNNKRIPVIKLLLSPFIDFIFWIVYILLHLQSFKANNVWK